MTDDKRGMVITFDEDGYVDVEALGDITNPEALWLLEATKLALMKGEFEEAEE